MLCLTLWTPTVEAGRRIEGMVGFIEILTGAERAHGREQEVSGISRSMNRDTRCFVQKQIISWKPKKMEYGFRHWMIL